MGTGPESLNTKTRKAARDDSDDSEKPEMLKPEEN